MNDVHVVAASKGIQVTRNIPRLLRMPRPVVTQQQWRLLLGNIHTNLGGILAPAKTVKPQALLAPVILVAGAATRDEAASDTPRPDARDLPEAGSVSQSRNSDASFLTANPGGAAIADAWAYGSCIIYGKH